MADPREVDNLANDPKQGKPGNAKQTAGYVPFYRPDKTKAANELMLHCDLAELVPTNWLVPKSVY